MLKVDLLYSNYLNSPDGASRFVKTMNSQKDLFNKNGIDLRIITPDLFSHKEFVEGSKVQPSLLVKLVRFLSRFSVMFTMARIYRAYETPAQRLLDYYDDCPDKGQIVAFQEGFTAYVFLKKYNKCQQNVIVSLHTNGELWSTLAQSLPRIESILMRNYRQDFERTLFSGCDKIGFVADLPRRHFCDLYPYREDKTFYVYNGIEPIPYGECPKPKTLDLICVGSLTKNKNQMGILNAIASLPESYQKKVSFTIVGDGTERPALEERAKELTAKIVFTGSSREVHKYLMMANCFILFSKNEGLPMSIIEGMRSGLPVIGTKVGGIPEQIIDGKTGFIVDVDEQQLAERLCYLVDHIDLLEQMGLTSYNYFLEKFTLEAMVKKYAEIYKC